MEPEAYFQRIGFDGSQDASLSTLQELHSLHSQAIPFENLDAFLSREVSVQPQEVFHKLVVQGRGGYCFEQNLLFATMLKQLGFTVSEHAARVVWRSQDKTQIPRTHMLLKITVDGNAYIADVGFGGLTMTAPLLLEPGLLQHSSHEDFRISQNAEEYTISVRLQDDWKPMYIFDLVSQYPVDFEMANHYVATYPQSIFLHNLMLGRVSEDGRHALLNRQYTKYQLDGSKVSETIDDADRLISLLENAFKIKLQETVDLAALRNKFAQLE